MNFSITPPDQNAFRQTRVSQSLLILHFCDSTALIYYSLRRAGWHSLSSALAEQAELPSWGTREENLEQSETHEGRNWVKLISRKSRTRVPAAIKRVLKVWPAYSPAWQSKSSTAIIEDLFLLVSKKLSTSSKSQRPKLLLQRSKRTIESAKKMINPKQVKGEQFEEQSDKVLQSHRFRLQDKQRKQKRQNRTWVMLSGWMAKRFVIKWATISKSLNPWMSKKI